MCSPNTLSTWRIDLGRQEYRGQYHALPVEQPERSSAFAGVEDVVDFGWPPEWKAADCSVSLFAQVSTSAVLWVVRAESLDVVWDLEGGGKR